MSNPDERPLIPSANPPEAAVEPVPHSVSIPLLPPYSPSSVQRDRQHHLRHEIRVWTRDLLIAIGLALIIIIFLYQPVKVEGTSII